MSYAFLIVVSVAITVKLLFLSFSLYFTLHDKDAVGIQTNGLTKHNKTMVVSWKEIPRIFLPKTLYCPEVHTKNYPNKL